LLFQPFSNYIIQNKKKTIFSEFRKKKLRQPGIEPGTAAWKATMLTITPLTLVIFGL
jgi:hypothetical protein